MNHPVNGTSNKSDNIDFVRKCAFLLFAREGINKVTMSDIAKESRYGIATVYRYFKTKKQLVVEIEVEKINSFIIKITKGLKEFFPGKKAIDGIDYLLSWFAYLYKNERDWLKFDSNFDGYVQQEFSENEQDILSDYYICLEKLGDLLNIVYEQGKIDHSIKMDQTKEKMFFHLMYSMLSITERLALGIIFYDSDSEEALNLIEMQRKMVVEAYRA